MRAIFTDLDGSLHDRCQGVHSRAYSCLQHLAHQDVLRVIITGRSLHSALKVLPQDFPIDYLVFSSGAGILHWKSQKIIQRFDMSIQDSQAVRAFLQQQQWDFMVQACVPDNHFFSYHQYSELNLDFRQRLQLYQNFASPIDWSQAAEACSEYLVIVDQARTLQCFQELQSQFQTLNIIRVTSPLDGCSGWLEIFPATVSKSLAAQWFCQHLGVQNALAFGNDYNDLDLLHWADMAFVVQDAPAELRQCFPQVLSAADGGFADAVEHWL